MADNRMVAFNSGEPTRVSEAGAGTAPDITVGHGTLSSRVRWRVGSPLGSDHLPLHIDLEVGPPGRSTPPRPRNNYRRAAWEVFRRNVTTRLTTDGQWTADRCHSLDAAARQFADITNRATYGCVPRGSLPRPKGWWSADCARARDAFRTAHNHLRRNRNDPAAVAACREARVTATSTFHQAKRESWRGFLSTLDTRSPSTEVWPTIRSLDGRGREGLPDCPVSAFDAQGRPVGSPAHEDRAKANLAIDSFAAASRTSIPRADSAAATATVREYLRTHRAGHTGPEGDFTTSELESVLRRSGGKAAGKDRVHPLLLRQLPQVGKAALLSLLNRSWREGRVPAAWRTAIIVPIPKKWKPPGDIKSRRPVSLLSTIGWSSGGCRLGQRGVV